MVTVDNMKKEEVMAALNGTFPPDEEPAPAGAGDWQDAGGGNEEIWKFDENPVLQGRYIDIRRNVGEYGSNMYIIQTPDLGGKIYAIWGSTVLDGRFFSDVDEVNPRGRTPRIPIGSEVRVEYLGEDEEHRKKGKKATKMYKVLFRQPAQPPMQEA
jgi:hypothetical protein